MCESRIDNVDALGRAPLTGLSARITSENMPLRHVLSYRIWLFYVKELGQK